MILLTALDDMLNSERPADLSPRSIPLAQRMRPRTMEEFVGQRQLLGPGKALRNLLEHPRRASLILWGPPGSGKTTLCRLLGNRMGGKIFMLSAVMAGIKEFRNVVEEAQGDRDKASLLFVDEIHRWNKAQQDALLPHLESGLLTLLGATTQNPSFEVIPPLLSRCRVYTLEPLTLEEISEIVRRAFNDKERGLGTEGIEMDEEVPSAIAGMSGGDARVALNQLELAAGAATSGVDSHQRLNLDTLAAVIQERPPGYDKGGEDHYNLISAFIKSMRGSDPDAAVYWLARMLKAGADPRFIARRMMILASEDVGNADPRGLQVAVAAFQAFEIVGLPEGFLPLAHAAVYLAGAPKSNAVYKAYREAEKAVDTHGSLPVPLHLRNAPTGLLKRLGYGRDYRYDHDYEHAYSGQTHLPSEIESSVFYRPSVRGYEKKIGEWLKWLKQRVSSRTNT